MKTYAIESRGAMGRMFTMAYVPAASAASALEQSIRAPYNLSPSFALSAREVDTTEEELKAIREMVAALNTESWERLKGTHK
jgi:hypothetical protein